MYWIESKPRIQRSNLNGTDIKELVTSTGTPLVMALNPLKGRMYWADGGNSHIMSSDMDGQNSHNMFMKDLDPVAMALYGTILGCLVIPYGNLRTIIICFMLRVTSYRKLYLFDERIL